MAAEMKYPRKSEEYRMRRAVGVASIEHDGAYNDPVAMEIIATDYGVPLDRLVRLTAAEVASRNVRACLCCGRPHEESNDQRQPHRPATRAVVSETRQRARRPAATSDGA